MGALKNTEACAQSGGSLLKSISLLVIFRHTDVAMENDEATKLQKRIHAVESVKARPIFAIVTTLPDQPAAPDPHAEWSKRQWERAMMNYRHELHAKLNQLSVCACCWLLIRGRGAVVHN